MEHVLSRTWMFDGSTTTIIRDDITKAKAILLVTVAVLHTAATIWCKGWLALG